MLVPKAPPRSAQQIPALDRNRFCHMIGVTSSSGLLEGKRVGDAHGGSTFWCDNDHRGNEIAR